MHIVLNLLIIYLFIFFVNGSHNESPFLNWTKEYSHDFAEFAFDFASAAYSPNPTECLAKHGAVLEYRAQIPCDIFYDEVIFIVIRIIGARSAWHCLGFIF